MSGQRSMLPVARVPTTDACGDTPFFVNSIRYLAGHPVENWTQNRLLDGLDDFSLVTIIQIDTGGSSPTNAITENWIEDVIQHYQAMDDVFQPAFLSIVFVCTSEEQKKSFTEETRRYLYEQGTNSIYPLDKNETVPPGPYVVLQHRLHHIWRLYDDTHGTFMTALRPQEGPFVELKLSGEDPSFSAIAVPSRIHRQPTKEKPLNGMRFAVKDLYHLKGIHTSFGSRSYYNIHGPESVTADAVTKLQNFGAIVLGKLKMTQYGVWEEPVESIDYQAPWNPRADGFQSPGGSSSGPACALAAYDWMDVTLGSDTTGSILRPGLWAGIFGLRPTWHAVSNEGMGGAIEQLDMAGCYSRSIQGLKNLSSLWLNHDELLATPKSFTSIIWASDMWDPVDKLQRELARDFVRDLETHLGITSRNISFEQVWNQNPPPDAKGSSLGDYINDACNQLYYELYLSFKPFIKKHEKKFGFPPYLSPANTANWKMFESLTEDEWKVGLKRMEIYRSWFRTAIVEGGSEHALFILPIEYLAPRYRDEAPDFRRPPPGVNCLTLSPVMKAPELVVPIGEIPYQSRITKQEEKLPFAIGVMGPPGTDLHLMDVLQDVFEKSGRPDSVHTGKWLYKRQDKPSWLGGSEIDEA